MARGWRVTETYIRCICDSITMGNNLVNVFKYHPVIGSGYIEVNGDEEWGDNVIPIEYDRFKTKVELLKDLKYSVGFIANQLGTTEDEIRKIVGKDYESKDFTAVRAGYFALLEENNQLIIANNSLRDEISSLKRQYEILQAKHDAVAGVNDCCNEDYKRLSEENAKLKIALESEMADNLQFEQRGKELTEKNDILTKQLDKAEDEINDLKERYRTLQAQCAGVCNEDSEKLAEENANLTKQISDLRSAYDRIYISRDEYIKRVEELGDKNARLNTALKSEEEANDILSKQIEALECKVEELTEENEGMRITIGQLSEAKNAWAEEALRYKEELATAKGKHAEAMRSKNGLEYEAYRWKAEARDYKNMYLNSKGSYTELSKKYTNLMAEVERLRTHNRTLTDLIADSTSLRSQRNMAIRLLFCTHDYDEIANALHIPESLVRVIICEKVVKEETT